MKSLFKGLVVDLDNTLYNWVDFFAPCFRAMVHVLSRSTHLEEDVITESFRRVYKEHKSVEYAYAIQELDIWKSLDWSDEKIERDAIKPARGAFRRTRSKHFHLYPNVKETLIWACHQAKLIIIGLSDAPIFQAEMRLKSLQIDRFFSGLFSWEGYHTPEHILIPLDVKKKIQEDRYQSRISVKQNLASSDTKPNPSILRSIIGHYKLDVKETYLIGDSLEKDIALAQEVGVTDIWARYGKTVKPQSLKTLAKITHWGDEEIERSKKAHLIITPTYTIDDFSEIKDIIDTIGSQLSFGFQEH